VAERLGGAATRAPLAGLFLNVLPAVAYAAGIFVMGLAPNDPTAAPGVDDKTLHLIAFGVMAVLATRAAVFLAPRRGRNAGIVAGGTVAMILGAALEILQSFTPDRTPEFADLGADLVGVLVASALLYAHSRWVATGREATP
jgi:VanZ family protein